MLSELEEFRKYEQVTLREARRLGSKERDPGQRCHSPKGSKGRWLRAPLNGRKKTIRLMVPGTMFQGTKCESCAHVTWGDMLSLFDRLIQKHGPDTCFWSVIEEHLRCLAACEGPVEEQEQAESEAGEDRSKDTDEVADASKQDDGDLHGGDGASGEVEDSKPTGGPEGEAEKSDKGESENGGDEGEGEGEGGDSDNGESENGGEMGEGKGAGGEPSDEAQSDCEGDSVCPQASPSDGETEAGGDGKANGSHAPQDVNKLADEILSQWEESIEETEGSQPSKGPKAEHGGINAELSWKRRNGAEFKKEVAEIKRSLSRLLRKMGTPDTKGELSPRYRGSKLVKELTSRRVSLSRARREELGPRPTLLLADVSGSCSAFCAELSVLCETIAETENVVIVLHSNGYPCQVDDRNSPAPLPPFKDGPAHMWAREWWGETIKAINAQGVISFGDWDAAETCYRPLCETGVPFYLLDSYCASYGAAPAGSKYLADLRSIGVVPKDAIIGVSGAPSTAWALREILRRRK